MATKLSLGQNSIKLSFTRLTLFHNFAHVLPGFYLFLLINRPGAAGAVLQTPLSLCHSFSQSVTDPFPHNFQNIINPKPYNISHVKFHM